MFIGQQLRCVRIAVTILCIFWHSVHSPRAVKYITCRVMSFRPWQASNGPLRGLSCLRGGIALIPSIPIMSCPASPFISSIFFLPVCQSLVTFYSSVFISVSPLSHPLPPLLPSLISYPSVLTSFAPWRMVVICDQHATECRNSLQCHDPETPH